MSHGVSIVRPGQSWWTRPGGGREVMQLALPLVISTSSWTIMHFIDRLFLLWHSPDALAAALPGGMLSFTVECFFLGVAIYTTTFVAQYHGAGRPHRIGVAVWQGVWLSLISAPLLMATIPLAPAVFRVIGHSSDVQQLEVAYYQILCYGAGAMVSASALSAFFTGRGRVRTVAVVDSFSALINIVLDYVLIFGHWGFAEYGIVGAAWATVIALWFRPMVYLALMFTRQNRERYGVLSGCRFDPQLFWRLLRFGSPAGVQMLFEVSAFTGFVMLVGRIGPLELTATNLAFNVNALAFVPMMGMSMAVTTLVGQRLGQNQPDIAARGTWTAFWMASLYMGLIGTAYVATPGFFLLPHGAEMDPTQFAKLSGLTYLLLRFVAAYCLFDMMNIVFVGALKGAGDMRFILLTTVVMSPVPVILAWLGTDLLGLGLYWCWTMVTLWVTGLGVIYMSRFLQGRWRDMRVIEPGLPEADAEPLDQFEPEPVAIRT
jgi:MATE family multidrug resistance protein